MLNYSDMSIREKDTGNQHKGGVTNYRKSELTHRVIDAICGSNTNRTEPVCEICRQKHHPLVPCLKVEAVAKPAIKPSINSGMETANNAQSAQEAPWRLLAQAEQKATSYTKKLSKVRIAAAKRLARVKSELETKARDYADSVIRVKSEALESLAKQKEEMEAQAAETAAMIRAEAEQKILAQCAKSEEKIREYRTLLDQAQAGTEDKLNTISKEKGELEEKLNTQIEARNRLEVLIKQEQDARADSEKKLDAYRQRITEIEKQMQLDEAQKNVKAESSQKIEVEIPGTASAETRIAEPANTDVKTGTCECCGTSNIKERNLVRIDSGQLFCPVCYEALKGSSVS